MPSPLRYLLPVLLLLAGLPCRSQTVFRVSDPRIEMSGETVHIYFDILEADRADRFDVTLLITDQQGKPVDASALAGDLGENIGPGSEKHISWNLAAEGITLNAQLFFEIEATLIGPEIPDETLAQQATQQATEPATEQVTQPADTKPQNTPEETEATHQATKQTTNQPSPTTHKETQAPPKTSSGYRRSQLLLQSVALPGLGLTRHTGKPHWIKGVAAYTCVAGAITLRMQASKNFQAVDDATYYVDKVSLYDKSIWQDNVSEVLGFTAAGIWAVDIVWTLIRTSHSGQSAATGLTKQHTPGLSLSGGIDALAHCPTVKLSYTF